MHGTLTVDYHTWRWAGSVMEHHRRTRAWLQSQIAATVRAAAESAGATDGVRRAVAREVEEAEADQRFSGQWATALDGTANWAQGRGPFTRRDASRAGRSGSLRATRAGDLLTDLTVQGAAAGGAGGCERSRRRVGGGVVTTAAGLRGPAIHCCRTLCRTCRTLVGRTDTTADLHVCVVGRVGRGPTALHFCRSRRTLDTTADLHK